MLLDYITEDLIELQVQVKDWEGAVRAGGKLLVGAGICEPRHVEAMVEAVKKWDHIWFSRRGLPLPTGDRKMG